MTTEEGPKESRPEEVELAIVDLAIRAYQHAETVVQSRLYNFLFAESILLLSWAAVFSTDGDPPGRTIVLSVLALLATVLGLVWAIVGSRHRVFLRLHDHIVRSQESRLAPQWQTHAPISRLQQGQVISIDSHETLVIGPVRIWFGERNLGTLAPLAMALAAAVLLYVALRG